MGPVSDSPGLLRVGFGLETNFFGFCCMFR